MVLQNVKKILIINLGGIGDLLLSLPAIKALRASYKDARIDIVVVDRVHELVRDAGLFDRVFLYKRSGFENLSLCMRLRRNRYDLAINMRTIVSWLSAVKAFLFFAMIHSAISAGRNTDGRGFFFDIKIPETGPGGKYEMEYDIDTVEALGAPVTDRAVRFDIDEASSGSMEQLLARRGIARDGRLIGIHAGGAPSHRWPIEHFAQAIQMIAGSLSCVFVLTGSASERKYVSGLSAAEGVKAINLAGDLTLRQLGALIKRCDLFISNDTGPIHIAAALHTPLVAIFGPGYLIRYDPRHVSDKAVVVQKGARCAPCDRWFCASMQCLKHIAPQEVRDAALRLLTGPDRMI